MKYVTTKINGKWELKLPEFRAKQWDKLWEEKRLNALYVHTHKDSVVYYVGAETGDMPALMQSWGAKLYLFEPSPKMWSIIRAIYKANKLERPVGLFAMFASDETNLKPEKVDEQLGEGWRFGKDNWVKFSKMKIDESAGFAHLNEQADGIPQVAIDDVVSQFDMDNGTGTMIPDIITIDVEGAEMKVLQGAEMTIESFKPKIFLSLHPDFLKDRYDTDADDVRAWIKSKGYKEKVLDEAHEIHILYIPKVKKMVNKAKKKLLE